MRTANITLDLYAIFVAVILLCICLFQRRQSALVSKYLLGWMFAHILVLCCDMTRWYLRGKIAERPMFSVMFFSEYILCHACLIFFHYDLMERLKTRAPVPRVLRLAVWPVAVVMSVLWVLSSRNRMFYSITYNAVNVAGDWYYLSQAPAMALLLFDMGLVLYYRRRKGLDWQNSVSLWLSMAFPLASFPLQTAWNAKALFAGMTLSLLVRYVAVCSEQSRLLAESRVAIAMDQIHPHFLYNALGSISALCDIDPVRARDATDHFAEYLRINLEFMQQSSPIPFQMELEHIQTYIWLEKMRFGEKIQINYDIQARDFEVPALSVQPIVENAVKHGVCMKDGPGTITLSTRKSKDWYLIIVTDDGIGFQETEEPGRACPGKKLQVGIRNVRERLEILMHGSLTVWSKSGEGTTAVIQIPRGRCGISEYLHRKKR